HVFFLASLGWLVGWFGYFRDSRLKSLLHMMPSAGLCQNHLLWERLQLRIGRVCSFFIASPGLPASRSGRASTARSTASRMAFSSSAPARLSTQGVTASLKP